MRVPWLAMPWMLSVALAHGEPAKLPEHYAALFDAGRTFTYDVATTTYDQENWGPKTRPPKKTERTIATCKVAKIGAIGSAQTSAIECDHDIEVLAPVAGLYVATADGLFRVTALPATEAELATLGEPLLSAKPRAFRTAVHGVHGLRGSHVGWCTYDDTSDDVDGSIKSQCYSSSGIATGDFDGGGEEWRKVSYRLRAAKR